MCNLDIQKHVSYKIDIKNTNIFYAGSPQRFPIVWGEKHLKHVSTHLYYINYNEINIR